MKRNLTVLTCLLGILLGSSALTIAWSADQPGTLGSNDRTISKEEPAKPPPMSRERRFISQWQAQNERERERKDRRPLRGFSTTVIVTPPVQVVTPVPLGYYGYGGSWGYSPYEYYPRNYQQQPWGYDGPPIIAPNERYDSALIWNRFRQAFEWQPIFPPRSGSAVAPIVNPNFVPPKKQEPVDYSSSSEQMSSYTAPTYGSGSGAGPAKALSTKVNWVNRALVSSVDQSQKQLGVITPEGKYIIDARDAAVVRNGWRVGLPTISEGDSVYVTAEVTGLNKVKASRIEVMGKAADQTAEEALKPVQFSGKIINIDYTAFTLKVRTDNGGEYRVLAGDSTRISSPDNRRTSFMFLKLGQTVKVVGLGGLTTGYAANEIVVTNPGATAKLKF